MDFVRPAEIVLVQNSTYTRAQIRRNPALHCAFLSVCKMVFRNFVELGTAVLVAFGTTAAWASNDVTRPLPLVYSFYADELSCAEREGEETRTITWNGQRFSISALASLVSPSSETKRLGTPLDVRPLETFLKQIQSHDATRAISDAPVDDQNVPHLRLVLVVHSLSPAPSGVATFSLQSIVAVRLCTRRGGKSASFLYVSPRKGATIRDRWARRMSDRWVEGYRAAFALAVADTLIWAWAEAANTDVFSSP